MKKWTILRAYFVAYLTCCMIFTIVNWRTLSYEESWGIVYLFGLIFLGLIGLLTDFILSLIIKNKRILNVIGILIALGFSIMLWNELK